ncbi:MAG: hypothetical protein PVS2B2_07660 [Candidatus Acidiferrum sp.]
MSGDVHSRARQMLAQDRVEGISGEEHRWLQEHLADCANCATFARETAQALESLRGLAVAVPRSLASRTQMRVRMRAEELRRREPGRIWLWALTAVSWVLGVATAPYVWHGFAWMGQEARLPKSFLAMGFVLWWAVPALLATGMVLLERRRQTRELQ